MATSTSTLLQVVNRVLLDVGERSTTSFQRPAANKAKAYVQDAFNDMQLFHDWEWLMSTQSVDSWSTDTATLIGVRRIRFVGWDTGDGFVELPFVDNESFDFYNITEITTDDTVTRPLRWTKIDEDSFRLNPYPVDTTARAKIKCKVVKYFEPPTNTTGAFSCPERFINCLTKRAVYMMLLRHLGDQNAAQALEGEFEQLLATFRSKESNVPSSGFNMFKNISHGIVGRSWW